MTLAALLLAQPGIAAPPSAFNPSPRQSNATAGPLSTNFVLELDGNESYVQLPAGILEGLREVTVEGWVRRHHGDK